MVNRNPAWRFQHCNLVFSKLLNNRNFICNFKWNFNPTLKKVCFSQNFGIFKSSETSTESLKIFSPNKNQPTKTKNLGFFRASLYITVLLYICSITGLVWDFIVVVTSTPDIKFLKKHLSKIQSMKHLD